MKFLKRLVIFLFFIPIVTSAQKNELMLSLSAGISSPLGDFTSTEYVIDDDGNINNSGQFAKLGGAFDFSLDYRLGYYLGFAGRIMGGTNGVDTKAYSDALNSILKDNSNLEATVASKGWGNVGFLAGAYFVIPSNQFYFDLRIMAGYIDLFSPSIRYYITDTETEEEALYVSEKYSAGGFAYDLGIGVKYMFSSNKFISLNGDYIGAKVQKSNIKTINPISKEDEFVDMDVNYQNITVTLGIGYIF